MNLSLPKTTPGELAARVRCIVPGAHIVRTTPVWTTRTSGTGLLRPVAFALDEQRRQLPIPPGGDVALGALLSGQCPAASPWQSLTWHADTGAVTPWQPFVPNRSDSVEVPR